MAELLMIVGWKKPMVLLPMTMKNVDHACIDLRDRHGAPIIKVNNETMTGQQRPISTWADARQIIKKNRACLQELG
jgi:hypothetical protein